MKKILKFILISLIFTGALLYITDKTYLIKALTTVWLRGNTDVTLYDFEVQPTRKIEAKNKQPWVLHEKYNTVELSDEIIKHHQKMKSTAFLIIKDGKILSEHYFDEGSQENLSGMWSITKTYTSLLILKAIEDGLISSVDDPVTKHFPEWQVKQEIPLTLRHLASMSSGLYWNEAPENHTPLALVTKLNFYRNLEKLTLEDLYAIGNPGEKQNYDSGGTQILGTVLDRVLGEKTITDYLEEKFWRPLGYEYDGLYILDSKEYQNEKTFGGIVSTARDISRLGQLINNNGIWKGERILSPSDIDLIKTLPYNNETYNYGLWTYLYNGHRYYQQEGYLGQYCISFPKHGLVITRLGHDYTDEDSDLFIEEALRIVKESGINMKENSTIENNI